MCPARSSYTTWTAASRWVAQVRVAVFSFQHLDSSSRRAFMLSGAITSYWSLRQVSITTFPSSHLSVDPTETVMMSPPAYPTGRSNSAPPLASGSLATSSFSFGALAPVIGVRVLLSLWYSALRWTFLPFSIAPSATTLTFTVGPYSGCLSSASRFTHCLCGSPGGGQESLIGEILSTFASHSMPVFLLHFLSSRK